METEPIMVPLSTIGQEVGGIIVKMIKLNNSREDFKWVPTSEACRIEGHKLALEVEEKMNMIKDIDVPSPSYQRFKSAWFGKAARLDCALEQKVLWFGLACYQADEQAQQHEQPLAVSNNSKPRCIII